MGRRSWERKIGKRGRRKKEERNKEKGEKIGRRRRGEGEGLGTWGKLRVFLFPRPQTDRGRLGSR